MDAAQRGDEQDTELLVCDCHPRNAVVGENPIVGSKL